MKKPILVLVAIVALCCGALALAQEAPLRGVGLLALNGDSQGALGGAAGRNAQVATPDDGGGGGGIVHRERGAGDAGPAARLPREDRAGSPARMLPDALPPAVPAVRGDPAVPAAATPKRPSYRWQSLVPGAIK